ncbi:DnaA regulatory inactivator Hda [Chitinibacter bivalviorum]|uniref:DnaA regulatory inactivator Hda n=1 Tax=Chitinibacter bivalviorum TaxID=2739434 RepID=A0A7H9BEH5_9NEIS|nr:DnaA regulatory inactivator Hda [Chitinibacter bivalviorum]QLG87019.1 DnaA regulatory inactivator Hda [Chitinibacter bivalviorum]
MKQLLLDLLLPAPRTFDDFVRGENAELLFQLGEWAQGDVRALYIWGESGAGKSHLLSASEAKLDHTNPVYFVNAREEMLPQQIEGNAALLVDNVESLDAEQQIALFDHYNTLREGGGRILVSGTLPPMLLALRDDLTTRLGWGLVYQLKSLSDEDKIAALQRRSRHLGFELQHDLGEYLLNHAARDLPSLYFQLEQLNQLALSRQKQVTLSLLRDSLKQNTTPRY